MLDISYGGCGQLSQSAADSAGCREPRTPDSPEGVHFPPSPVPQLTLGKRHFGIRGHSSEREPYESSGATAGGRPTRALSRPPAQRGEGRVRSRGGGG